MTWDPERLEQLSTAKEAGAEQGEDEMTLLG